MPLAFDAALPGFRCIKRGAFILTRAPYLALAGLCCLGLASAAVLVGSSLYAMEAGWALPTTAAIRWFPAAEWAAKQELYLGHLLLMLAGLGTLATWFSALGGQHNQSLESERKMTTLLRWSGLPIVACAFVFGMSAMWAGIVRPGDLHGANIAGLVPYNDAHGHILGAFAEMKDGTWPWFVQRRPIAAAVRSVLLFVSDYSLTIMLLVQVCLVAAAACLAAYAVVIWRGVWAGIAFLALTYIYARSFAPTTLTEPLGLIWSLLSIPFFIDAFRSGSAKPALVGFAMASIALMIRMGSMFFIPALMLWLVWRFGRNRAAKIRIGALAVVVLFSVLALNSLLERTYGTSAGETGSNFSYVLCGLSIGTTWDGCSARLAARGTPLPPRADESTAARELYLFAWQNIRARPEIFFGRLLDGARTFITDFPTVMWNGYGASISEPAWLFRRILTAISLIGLLCLAVRKANAIEIGFWALFWASIVASSAFVYHDDGARTLAASQPLMALFFATGMSNPVVFAKQSEAPPQLFRSGLFSLVTASFLFLTIPWVTHRFPPVDAIRRNVPATTQDEIFVLGSDQMSGFLVVADGKPLRPDIPSIHLGEFMAIAKQSGIYQNLPPLAAPFGFVFAPKLKYTVSSSIFIVPTNFMEHPEVAVWRLKLARGSNSSGWPPVVAEAEPWSP